MEKEIRAAYARMGLRSEEEMIAEEEITWKEAESAKQQQEAELDLQAAEDEDEARLAAHLDFEVELDTSEWEQNNPREYGTPSPVRRWREELMAKKDREEEEEKRIVQCAEEKEEEKMREDRKELEEKYGQHVDQETPEEDHDDQAITHFWSDDYLDNECRCGECAGGDLSNDCWHADEHAVNLHIEAEEEERINKLHPIYRTDVGIRIFPIPERMPPAEPLHTGIHSQMSIDALIEEWMFAMLELKDLCQLWTTDTKWWNRWKLQHKVEMDEKRQQCADSTLWGEVEEERIRRELMEEQAQIEADAFFEEMFDLEGAEQFFSPESP